jgi:hypothetical protein
VPSFYLFTGDAEETRIRKKGSSPTEDIIVESPPSLFAVLTEPLCAAAIPLVLSNALLV